ncbi:hypothetical protein RG47T_1861 [Mucilaginibacter polytrichastri]|uniref:Uncharacterized protein n=1 Tax=Mucilaginibacter polytrichastri TaxID=1302689 RepID=A0A1Q5ZXA4_9SPHI|nr:hypothetical protein RG47T_1861 [Mucilaginibacter polytrichastri]
MAYIQTLTPLYIVKRYIERVICSILWYLNQTLTAGLG